MEYNILNYDRKIRERESPKRDFHIGDILSVTTRRCVSPRGMDGVHDILDFMMGVDSLKTHQLPEAADHCIPYLLQQHPQLKDVDKSEINEDNWQAWLEEQVVKYGQKLPVEALSLRNRVIKDYMNVGLLDDKEFIFTSLGDDSK